MKSLATVAVALAATVAVAEARAVAVPVRDVDFSSAASVDAFHRTLAEAARDACRGARSTPGLAGFAEIQDCRAGALDRAVADLDRPMLTALDGALEGRLRLNPARPALSESSLAALETAAGALRADARTGAGSY